VPGLRGKVDAQLGDRGLGGHGFSATPQITLIVPPLSRSARLCSSTMGS
jgi:hypothetical protein